MTKDEFREAIEELGIVEPSEIKISEIKDKIFGVVNSTRDPMVVCMSVPIDFEYYGRWMATFFLPTISEEVRNRIIPYLREKGITVNIHEPVDPTNVRLK